MRLWKTDLIAHWLVHELSSYTGKLRNSKTQKNLLIIYKAQFTDTSPDASHHAPCAYSTAPYTNDYIATNGKCICNDVSKKALPSFHCRQLVLTLPNQRYLSASSEACIHKSQHLSHSEYSPSKASAIINGSYMAPFKKGKVHRGCRPLDGCKPTRVECWENKSRYGSYQDANSPWWATADHAARYDNSLSCWHVSVLGGRHLIRNLQRHVSNDLRQLCRDQHSLNSDPASTFVHALWPAPRLLQHCIRRTTKATTNKTPETAERRCSCGQRQPEIWPTWWTTNCTGLMRPIEWQCNGLTL